jgi:hypothetical protein
MVFLIQAFNIGRQRQIPAKQGVDLPVRICKGLSIPLVNTLTRHCGQAV